MAIEQRASRGIAMLVPRGNRHIDPGNSLRDQAIRVGEEGYEASNER